MIARLLLFAMVNKTGAPNSVFDFRMDFEHPAWNNLVSLLQIIEGSDADGAFRRSSEFEVVLQSFCSSDQLGRQELPDQRKSNRPNSVCTWTLVVV